MFMACEQVVDGSEDDPQERPGKRLVIWACGKAQTAVAARRTAAKVADVRMLMKVRATKEPD